MSDDNQKNDRKKQVLIALEHASVGEKNYTKARQALSFITQMNEHLKLDNASELDLGDLKFIRERLK